MMGPLPRRGPGRPNANEAERKRADLLEAALEKFVQAGFRGASMRRIAAKAEISTRTLYNHFVDKTALFEACLEMMSKETESQVVDIESGGVRERLANFAMTMQAQLSSERSLQMARLINREGMAFRELREIARLQFYRYQVGPIERILEDNGVAPGQSHKLAVDFVVLALGDWQRRLVFDERAPTSAEMKQQAQRVTALFLDGASIGPTTLSRSSHSPERGGAHNWGER